MKREKEQRNIKVTVRFTESEMQMVAEQLNQRNKFVPEKDGLSVSGLIREKLLILDKSLELKKIRLELAVIDTQLKQIELYLSKRENIKESFLAEVMSDIEKHLADLQNVFEEVVAGGSDST